VATRRGGSRAAQKIRELPEAFLERILPRAGRKGGEVIAEDAKQRLGGKRAGSGAGKVLIADSVKVRVSRKDTRIRVRIVLEGAGAYVGRWLEYGTDPHFISVDPNFSDGRSARRINLLDRNAAKDGKAGPGRSLWINGKAVGATVHHPGGKAEPFLGPALHNREADAIAAMQTYVLSRAARAGIGHNGPPVDGDDA
jgi:hypothetical protein